MNQKKISFIGAGNMATAIIRGIANSTHSQNYKITAYDVLNEKVKSLEQYHVVAAATMEEAVTDADFLFLAIKPQNFEEVLTEIKPFLRRETVVVSIAAGITSSYLKSMLFDDCKVVLVMPNTPLLVGCGASALCHSDPTSEEEFQDVCDIFALQGEIAILPEDKMKEIIAIKGSSPAFIYLFTKGFVEYAKEVGIQETTALELFCQTLKGSAEMMLHSGHDLDTLIQMVSSKGGTTIAGLEQLQHGKLLETIEQACKSCTARAYELSK